MPLGADMAVGKSAMFRFFQKKRSTFWQSGAAAPISTRPWA